MRSQPLIVYLKDPALLKLTCSAQVKVREISKFRIYLDLYISPYQGNWTRMTMNTLVSTAVRSKCTTENGLFYYCHLLSLSFRVGCSKEKIDENGYKKKKLKNHE